MTNLHEVKVFAAVTSRNVPGDDEELERMKVHLEDTVLDGTPFDVVSFEGDPQLDGRAYASLEAKVDLAMILDEESSDPPVTQAVRFASDALDLALRENGGSAWEVQLEPESDED